MSFRRAAAAVLALFLLTGWTKGEHVWAIFVCDNRSSILGIAVAVSLGDLDLFHVRVKKELQADRCGFFDRPWPAKLEEHVWTSASGEVEVWQLHLAGGLKLYSYLSGAGIPPPDGPGA